MTRVRPSSQDLFHACPSSAQEVEHPYNPDNPFAELGTAVHEALAAAIEGADDDESPHDTTGTPGD